MKARGFGTHHMKIGENKQGTGHGQLRRGGGQGRLDVQQDVQGGQALRAGPRGGGLGRRDFNGDVILPDGAHGHMFIGFTKPTKTPRRSAADRDRDDGPGADSLVGYKHDWNSTEATANPESSFYGHKMQKIGGGKLATNQRLVDLNKLQTDSGQKWLDCLTAFGTLLDDSLAHATGRSAASTRSSPVRAPDRCGTDRRREA